MKPIYILCVEDEPEVLEVVMRDLRPLASAFLFESAASADEARQVVREVILPRGSLGLVVCDYMLPGDDGVIFLEELQKDPATAPSRKILLTAHAGIEPTVRAVNNANLNFYIAKPWKAENLVAVARKQLTDYVLEQETDLYRFLSILEPDRLVAKIRGSSLPSDE